MIARGRSWSPISPPILAAGSALVLLILGCLAADYWLYRKSRAELITTLETVRDTASESARAWIDQHARIQSVWTGNSFNTQQVLSAIGRIDGDDAADIALAKIRISSSLYRQMVAENVEDFFVVGPGDVTFVSSVLSEIGEITFMREDSQLLAKAWAGEQAVAFTAMSPYDSTDQVRGAKRAGVRMMTASPVKDGDGLTVAVVVTVADPREGLVSVLESGRIGQSGETYLFDRQARLITGGRFELDVSVPEPGFESSGDNAFISLIDPGFADGSGKARLTRMASSALAGESGVDVEGYNDYRGAGVVGAWLWNGELEFGVASEIGKNEAYQIFWNTRLVIALLGGVAAVLIVGLTSLFIRWRRFAEETDNLHREVINTSSAGFMAVDLDRERIVDVNQAMCSMLGYSRGEMIGRRPVEFARGRYRDQIADKVLEAKNSKHRQFETCFTARNGKTVELEVHATTVFDQGGRPLRSFGFFADIAERKAAERQLKDRRAHLEEQVSERTKALTAEIAEREKAEHALRKSEEFYRALYVNAGSGIAVTDLDGNFVQMNEVWTRYLGYGEKDLLSKKVAEITHEDDRDISYKWFERLVAGEIDSYGIEKRYVAKSGEIVWVDLRVSPIKDENGKVVATMGVSTDISDRKRTTQELYKKTAMWAQAERTAHLGHWYWDLDSGLVEWSDEVFRIHGTRPGAFEVKDDVAVQMTLPDDREQVRDALRTALKSRSDFNFECRIVHADGGIRHVLIKGRCELGANRRVVAMFGVIQDVTSRVLAETELARQKMQLDALLESMPQGVLNWDENGGLRFWNRAYLEMRGLREDEIHRGMPIRDLLSLVAERGGLGEGDSKLLAERRLDRWDSMSVQEHEEMVSADGRIFELTNVPHPGGGRTSIFNDVTERRRADAEIKHEKDRAEMYLEVASAIILVLDRSGDVVRINDEGCRVLGYAENEVVGRNWFTRFLPEKDGRKHEAGFRTLMAAENEPVDSLINPVVCKSGEQRVILWRNRAVRDPSGRILNMVSSGLDITESQKAEAALRVAKEEAEYANRAKSEFLANMSHELRTPLNAVLGFSEIIRDEMFGRLGSDHYREYASDIHASGEHLLGIINDILDLAKIEAGQVELQEEEFQVQSVVEPCVRLMRGRAEKARVTILAPEIDEDFVLWGDKRKFKQILLNLLSNAIKFTDAGGEVAIKVTLQPSGAFRLSVSDTGIGIEPEDLSKVMAPFSQVHNSLTRNHDGTGLGLPLVKSLCALHGGSLWLDSVVGVGTTASVDIPAERVLDTAHAPETQTAI